MWNILLLRHGQAQHYFPHHGGDRARGLTGQGILDIKTLADELVLRTSLSKIFHSPYLRARETAQLVNDRFKVSMEELVDLEPNGLPEQVLNKILGRNGNILLVTHMPLVAQLALHLTGRLGEFFPGTCMDISRHDAFSLKGNPVWVKNPF